MYLPKGKMTGRHFIEDFLILHKCAVGKDQIKTYREKLKFMDITVSNIQSMVVVEDSSLFCFKKPLSSHWF